MIRLYPGASKIGVGLPYGQAAYGRIGFGAQAVETSPRLVAPFYEEYSEPVEALVTAPYGVPAYGAWWVRQAQEAIDFDRLSMHDDRMSCPEFVEDESIVPVLMRLGDDGSVTAYELVES